MISIRKSCFETNSSSMHSLAIWKNTKPYSEFDLSLGTYHHTEETRQNGEFRLIGDYIDEYEYEFTRWPYRQLTTPLEKLRYIVGYYIRPEYDPVSDELFDNFESTDVGKELKRLIEKYTGYKKIKWYVEKDSYDLDRYGKRSYSTKKEYPSTSTVNDSGEDVISFIERKKISLEDLIFQPNYTIQVDGDEYQEFKEMFKFNIINLDNIEDISSGVDYWTDDYVRLYIQNIFDERVDEDGSKESYVEQLKKELQDKGTIRLQAESWKDLTADMCIATLNLLAEYKTTKKIKLGYFSDKFTDLKNKYFSEFER